MTEALLRLDDGPALRNNKVNMIAVVSKCVGKYPEAQFNLEAVLKRQRDGECLQMTPRQGKAPTINLTVLFTDKINMRTSDLLAF